MSDTSVCLSDGVELMAEVAGSGAPLLLLPGWSQSAAEFRHNIAALAQGRTVIALDQRGHGRSDKPAGGYRIQRLARDLHEVIGTLGLERPDVLGHSMGVSVIWSYLSMFGAERPLGRLVMVDQAPCVLAQPGWDDAARADAGCLFPDMDALSGFEAAVVASPTAAGTKELLRGMFTASVPEVDLDWIAAQNIALPRAHAAHLLHDHCVLDWRSQIAMVDNPTLVVGGEASIFPATSQRWIAARIPGAEVEIFGAAEGGSHFMFWENPARFNARVGAFLG